MNSLLSVVLKDHKSCTQLQLVTSMIVSIWPTLGTCNVPLSWSPLQFWFLLHIVKFLIWHARYILQRSLIEDEKNETLAYRGHTVCTSMWVLFVLMARLYIFMQARSGHCKLRRQILSFLVSHRALFRHFVGVIGFRSYRMIPKGANFRRIGLFGFGSAASIMIKVRISNDRERRNCLLFRKSVNGELCFCLARHLPFGTTQWNLGRTFRYCATAAFAVRKIANSDLYTLYRFASQALNER